MNWVIKHRWTNDVLYSGEGDSLKQVVESAVIARAHLADANLTGANLAGANLAGANLAGANLADAKLTDAKLTDADLAGANLTDAYLMGADLAGANLMGANLAGADLAGANLAGADLARANLTDAYLAGTNLTDADLAGANLAGANLTDAYLAGANLTRAKNVPGYISRENPPAPHKRHAALQNLPERAARYRERHPDVPVVPRLDIKILDILNGGEGSLDMSTWHMCKTTHCRAGWAITLAGEVGAKLERERGPHMAGRMIYLASTGRAPYFFEDDEVALEDIRKCALRQEEEK